MSALHPGMVLTSHDGKSKVLIVAMGKDACPGSRGGILPEQCIHILIYRAPRPILETFVDINDLAKLLALQGDGQSVEQ